VSDHGIGQRSVQEHQGTASLENGEVRGDDLPVVLRHCHCHDLVGASEEWRKCTGYFFRSRVEFSKGQGFSGVGICKAGKFGNFWAERLKTSVSHWIPF
jgi:hypothetical protein